jgi:hypothetical protein
MHDAGQSMDRTNEPATRVRIQAWILASITHAAASPVFVAVLSLLNGYPR